MDRYKITAIGIVVVVIITIIGALRSIDSPLQVAEQKKDEKRMQDFSQIFAGIDSYYQSNQKLPNKLSDLQYPLADQRSDAVTKKEYEYQIIDNDTFKLCTEFSTDSTSDYNERTIYSPDGTPKTHKEGYDCIEYSVKLVPTEKPRPL